MYDVIVVGGGAAGLTAGAYCSRGGLKTLIIEKYPVVGGQMGLTDRIDNFPAFENADAYELSQAMKRQADNAGALIATDTVNEIKHGNEKLVLCNESDYKAKAIIYAAGAYHRKLGIKGEDIFSGRGVSYCAVCDGGFYRGKTAAVIGGGDTALKEALYLSRICSEVYLIHRRDSFKGAAYLVNNCENTENIHILRSTLCTEITGDKTVNGIVVSDKNGERHLDCSGVFAAVGMIPFTDPLTGICDTDENGYIIAGEDCVTSAAGIFAAGDVRTKPFRQIVTACADGANAARSAEEYISALL